MQFVIILDYATGAIYSKQISEDTEIDGEWFKQYGLREDNCSWMVINDYPTFSKLD